MRLQIVLGLALLASCASADQLIDIPTGRKIPTDDFRYEVRASPYSHGDVQHFLGIGVGPSMEFDFREMLTTGSHPIATGDFAFNILSAVPSLAPGFSVGVQDAANLTPDGRRFYAVTTFRNELDELSGNLYADITVGMQFGSLSSPFVGAAVPLGEKIYLIAEHSGFRLSTGLELRPLPKVVFRVISRNQKTLLSLSALVKF